MAEDDSTKKAAAASRESHPHDVFISYSSQNKAVADTVCAVLELNGVRCWMAPRDITPGAEWAGSIIHAINDTRAFVLIFSTFANTSLQVKREVERAANRGVPIIPFRLDDIQPNETLEFFISTPHWLDALSPPLETHAEHLSRVVERLLGDTQPKLTRAKRRAASAEAVAETVQDAKEAEAAEAAAAAEPVVEAPPDPPTPPPVMDTQATIRAAQALAAAPVTVTEIKPAPRAATPPPPAAAIPGFQPNTAPGEAAYTAAIAQTRPPAHPLEPLIASGIGAAVVLLLGFFAPEPSGAWAIMILFVTPIYTSLFRLGFLRTVKGAVLGGVLLLMMLVAAMIGFASASGFGHGGALNSGQVFLVGLMSAFGFAAGSYAPLMLLGEKLANQANLRIAGAYIGAVTVSGGILAFLWATLNGSNVRIHILNAPLYLPWLALHASGFFAIASSTLNPFASAEGRRNVTEQAAARVHNQVAEPNASTTVLAAAGALVGVLVAFIIAMVIYGDTGSQPPPVDNGQQGQTQDQQTQEQGDK